MDQIHAISVDKTESGLLVVYHEKTENNTEKESSVKENLFLSQEDLIGKNEHEALALLKKHRAVYRIVERDGQSFEITSSHLPFRWQLHISNGVISKVRMG